MFLEPAQFIRDRKLLNRVFSLEEARAYTEWLARSHYENFLVASVLLPHEFHRAFFDIYAFCRWADDLGDELGSPEESLQWLGWLRRQLEAMYRGYATHPVFVALQATVNEYSIPQQYFHDLITAFEQDQRVTRYENFGQLLRYCRFSAVPVGRLVLWVMGYRDEERMRLADATCIGLQLVNFWQDIGEDLDRGRLYLPLEWLYQYGARPEQVFERQFNEGIRNAIQHAVNVTRPYFREGLQLARLVRGRFKVEVRMFALAGLKLLDEIETLGYNTLTQRPTLSRFKKWAVLARALLAV